MYFAFLQYYCIALGIPAVIGVLVHFFMPALSAWFSMFLALWSVIFISMWEKHEKNLAIKWGALGVQNMEIAKIPEDIRTIRERWKERIFSYSVIAITLVGIFGIQASLFSLQIYLNEIYKGTYRTYYVMLSS